MLHRVEALNGHHAHQIELLPGDDPTALLQAGVHALIGLGDAVARAGQVSCTPTILAAPAAPAGSWMPGGPGSMPNYVFQAGPSAAHVRSQLLSSLTVRNVGLLSLDPPDREDFAARGLTLAAAELIPPGATDLTRIAQAVVSAQPAPEAVVVDALPPLDGMAVRDLRAAGWTGPVLCGPSAVHSSFHAIAGAAAEDVVAVAPWLAAPQDAPAELANREVMSRFADGFTAAHGRPGAHAGFGADAVSLLHLAFLGHRDRKMAQAQLEQMCCVGVNGVYNPGLGGDALTRLVSKDGVWTVPENRY